MSPHFFVKVEILPLPLVTPWVWTDLGPPKNGLLIPWIRDGTQHYIAKTFRRPSSVLFCFSKHELFSLFRHYCFCTWPLQGKTHSSESERSLLDFARHAAYNVFAMRRKSLGGGGGVTNHGDNQPTPLGARGGQINRLGNFRNDFSEHLKGRHQEQGTEKMVNGEATTP